MSLAMVTGLALPAVGDAGPQVCSRTQTPEAIDARVDALIGRMTIAERVAQLGDRAPAIPRLGFPGYNWWNEGLHGLARNGYATVFPQAIGLAATWDAGLLGEVGDTVSTEARARFNQEGRADTPRYGGLTFWSPNINIFRDPRWGRGQETYGDDPFLTGMLGASFVHGMQGEDAFYRKTDATPKHFMAHSGPEEGRDSFNAVVSAHDLADTYERAFQRLTTEAHADALMCSYNGINGVPSCANQGTLRGLVRDQWHFPGYVVSDCDAVGNISSYQHFAPDAEHGAALALKAGVDLDCGNTYDVLTKSLADGLVTEAEINTALHRLLVARIHLGMLDPKGCTPWDELGAESVNSPQHADRAKRAAEEGIVLLRNGGVLPLKPGTHIAVIGPNADALKVLEANYHGTALQPVTPLEGLQANSAAVSYAQGSVLADGVPVPIARNALRTAAADSAPAGLTAEYFETASFLGTPTVTRIVPKVDLDTDRVGPAPEIHSRQWAARWSGFLSPPAPGDYTLRVDSERCWDCTLHDAYRLVIDDKVLLQNDGSKAEPNEVTLHFSDTTAHSLRLELLHTGDDEGIALEWIPPAEALLQQAVKAAAASDVVVAFVGLSPDLEGEALKVNLPGFAGGDRTSLDLPETQQKLLQQVAATGKPLVVVLMSGSAVVLGKGVPQPDALLEAWYPGQAGGTALAEVLGGTVNPSGRLPITFPRSVDDLPPFTDYSMAGRTYRYSSNPASFAFGEGLSYSHFGYSRPRLRHAQVRVGEPQEAEVTVTNQGPLDGDEVVELYLQPPAVPGAPRWSLEGVQRVHLRTGESRRVHFALSPAQRSTVDLQGKRQEVPGAYTVYVGGRQPDPLRDHGASFQIQSRPR